MPPPPTHAPNLAALFATFTREHAGTFALYGVLLFLAYPIEQIVFPTIYGQIVDVLARKSRTPLFRRTWWYLLVATVLLLVSQGLFTWIDYIDAYVQPAMQSFYRDRVLTAVMHTFEKKYKTLEIGNIVSKIAKMPLVLRNVYHQVRTYLLPAVIVSFCACVYFCYINAGLGAMLSVTMVCFFTFFTWKASACIPASQKRDAMCDKLNETIDDTLGNLLSVYTSTSVERERKRFYARQQTHDEQYTRSALCGVTFKAWYSLFYIGIFIAINGYAFYLTHTKALTMGQLVSVVFVTLYLIGNVGDFAGEIKDFMFDLGVLAEMQRYLDGLFAFGKANPRTKATHGTAANNRTHAQATPTSTHTTRALHITNGAIRFDHVTFAYVGNRRPALRDVSLTIPAKQSVAVVGQIGSGKSTLTRLLLRLYTPQHGRIYIDDSDITHADPVSVRKHIGYVAQNPVLFHRSIYENIVYGSAHPRPTKAQVSAFIRQAGVQPLFDTVPRGLDTSAGRRGEHLSGGQRQAVVLLRMALADKDKPIVLLDEPTSALDTESKHYVMRLLRTLMRDRTCIMVTHDTELLNVVERVVEFRGGGIVK